MNSYDPHKLEEKWDKKWNQARIYQPDAKTAANPYYNLMMFPYPSAEGLHVGNVYAFVGADVHARFQRMQGKDVFEPIGLDGFGIHSENFALKIGKHPMDLSKVSQENFYRQLHGIGNSFDWSKTLETYDPKYYKWTQWLFIQLFKAGLAYRGSAEVNYCPSCKTVLADEQVIGGECERCGSKVEKKELEQWFVKTTEYAEKLLADLDKIDWSKKVVQAQRNWIGKSEGLLFTAPVKDTKLQIDTFSAHYQAYCADTFVVIAPDHPMLNKIIEGVPNTAEVRKFADMLVEKRKGERPGEEKEPEGIFTGRYIVDPIGNGELPIWVANYALKDYGTGIVKCSAHDERDFAFAKKYSIRLKPVLFPKDPGLRKKVENLEICFTDMEEGILEEPDEFKGRKSKEVKEEIRYYLEKKGLAKKTTKYHLRDWLVSRQRYWGAPIPMIYCAECGWNPVPEADLPVELPYVENFKPLGTGESPLASVENFVKTKCPNCKGDARRETDVFDTFMDSSWYFLRYPSVGDDKEAMNPELTKKWLPVDIYIGGAEHSVLHLLYARFITKALFDLKILNFDEPFTKFRAHGLLVKEGAKMSKSRGNIINPDVYLQKFGADVLRLYLMFLGPYTQGGDFRDSGIEGMQRFLKRISVFAQKHLESSSAKNLETPELTKIMNKTVKKVTNDIVSLSYNTAIAGIMEYLNALNDHARENKVDQKYVVTLVKLIAPFAPYLAEEIYDQIDPKAGSVHVSVWPEFDESKTKDEQVTVAVQINGKLADTLISSLTSSQESAEKEARSREKVKSRLADKEIKKVIYVPGKIINFVV